MQGSPRDKSWVSRPATPLGAQQAELELVSTSEAWRMAGQGPQGSLITVGSLNQMDAVAVDDIWLIWEMRWNMIVSKHLILQRLQWQQWYNHAKPGRIPSFNGCHEPVTSVCSESAQDRLTLWVRYQLNLKPGPEAGPAVSQLSWVAQYDYSCFPFRIWRRITFC